jgi:hypothetical protein
MKMLLAQRLKTLAMTCLGKLYIILRILLRFSFLPLSRERLLKLALQEISVVDKIYFRSLGSRRFDLIVQY